MRWAFFGAALLFALVLGTTTDVFAQATGELQPSSLGWVRRAGAEACPGPNAMAVAVEQRLGRAVFVPAPRAALAVEALIEAAAPSGWHVAITISSADGAVLGRRDLSSLDASCRGVSEAAVLAIAVIVDPRASFAAQPAPTTTAPTTTAPTASPRAAKERAAAPRWRGHLDVAGALGFGMLPNVAAGVVVRARAQPPSFPLQFEVNGRYDFRQTAEAQDHPEAAAAFSLLGAGAALCSAEAQRRTLAAFACLGGETGVIATRSPGLLSGSQQAWMANLVARGQLSFAVASRWVISTAAEITVPLRRMTFEAVPEGGRVYQMAFLAGGFDLGAGYSF